MVWLTFVLAFELCIECVLVFIRDSGVRALHVDYAEVEQTVLNHQLSHSFVDQPPPTDNALLFPLNTIKAVLGLHVLPHLLLDGLVT